MGDDPGGTGPQKIEWRGWGVSSALGVLHVMRYLSVRYLLTYLLTYLFTYLLAYLPITPQFLFVMCICAL